MAGGTFGLFVFNGVTMARCYLCGVGEIPETVVDRAAYRDEVYGLSIYLTFLFSNNRDEFVRLCRRCIGISLIGISKDFMDEV